MYSVFSRFFIGLFVILSSFSAVAQEHIQAIDVVGNQRIESATVRSYVALQQGEWVDPAAIDNAVKTLFETNLFSEVNITLDEGVLTVQVQENPVINRIVFEGNKRLNEDQLLPEVQLQSRSVYTRAKVQADVRRIQSLYQKNGRFAVKVQPKAIQLDQNRIDLIYEVQEGQKTAVHKIAFVGNRYIEDDRLHKVINTKESRWWSFFSSGDTYDPDKVEFDKELLRKFYVSKGYADFRVTSAVAEITRDREAFVLTFILEEGAKYDFGVVKIDSQLDNVNETALRQAVKTFPDEVFNADLVDGTVDALTSHLNDAGYAFVDVSPVYDRDSENRLVGVTYRIEEGPKAYVNRINIRGNSRTLDKVIRREFRLAEGDPYNAAKLRRSEQRIRNLGFFETVKLQRTRDTDAGDRINVDVEVEEKSTGELNFGAGFSTADGALATVSVRERNLLGKGQDLRVSVERATESTQLQLSFTEPYFMDHDVSAGFDLYQVTRDLSSESSFDSDVIGGVLRASYSITEHLRHSVNYSLRAEEITDLQSDASLFIRKQEGKNTASVIGHTLMWDHRDDRFSPSNGFFVRATEEFAGLGGDSQYIRHEFRAAHYNPVIRDDVVLTVAGRAGHIVAWGDQDIRINERFFLGGDNLRGFKDSGVGPRDLDTRDALGGNLYYTGTTELIFPLGLPKELGFKGALFAEAGSLILPNEEGSNVLENDSLRMSAGVGIAWNSPFGPVRADYAVPFMKEDFDRKQEFRISFGTRF